MLRVLLADDELMARKRLTRLLSAMADVTLLGECTDGQQVLDRVEEGDVDVLLLDIHMPGLSGVDTLGLLGPDGPIVIFTTAHAEYAVQAFEGGAVDYVLKPVEAERLRKALERARERLRPPEGLPGRLPLPTARGVELLDVAGISHVVIEGQSTVVHTDKGPFYTDLRLSALERRLPADGFERVHRRALVNLARVARLEDQSTGGYLAHMVDGSIVAVSRQVARRLRKRWGVS